MSGFICRNCRAALNRTRTYSKAPRIAYSTAQLKGDKEKQDPATPPKSVDVKKLLSHENATWSVRTLLPSPDAAIDSDTIQTPPISPKQLAHLLRLSALPLPAGQEEEEKMLGVLESQLHFVRAIREVNTDGVEPLVQLRDETEEGRKEITIGLEQLKDALAKEERKGRNQRPRRPRNEPILEQADGLKWDALETAEEKVGRFFVVRSGKGLGSSRSSATSMSGSDTPLSSDEDSDATSVNSDPNGFESISKS